MLADAPDEKKAQRENGREKRRRERRKQSRDRGDDRGLRQRQRARRENELRLPAAGAARIAITTNDASAHGTHLNARMRHPPQCEPEHGEERERRKTSHPIDAPVSPARIASTTAPSIAMNTTSVRRSRNFPTQYSWRKSGRARIGKSFSARARDRATWRRARSRRALRKRNARGAYVRHDARLLIERQARDDDRIAACGEREREKAVEHARTHRFAVRIHRDGGIFLSITTSRGFTARADGHFERALRFVEIAVDHVTHDAIGA